VFVRQGCGEVLHLETWYIDEQVFIVEVADVKAANISAFDSTIPRLVVVGGKPFRRFASFANTGYQGKGSAVSILEPKDDIAEAQVLEKYLAVSQTTSPIKDLVFPIQVTHSMYIPY